MTELLLPGAGIPAPSEAIRPARSLSAKPGSTSFSGILRRAAESLRHSGATQPARPISILLPGSLPFIAADTTTDTKNLSVPTIPISQTESALYASDTIRVVTDPLVAAQMQLAVAAPNEDAPLQAGNKTAPPSPLVIEAGSEHALQQMQDVLHTLAGLVTTLLQQNQVQSEVKTNISVENSIPEVQDEIPTPLQVLQGENGENSVLILKNVLPPVTESSVNLEADQTVDEMAHTVVPTVFEGESRPEPPVLISTETESDRESSSTDNLPVLDTGNQVETNVVSLMSETLGKTDTNLVDDNGIIPSDIKNQKYDVVDTASEENTDILLVFVPSVGSIRIQSQPAKDGTLHLNVDIPREVPRTPRALHNLLREVTDAVQDILATNGKTKDDVSVPVILNSEIQNGNTPIEQRAEDVKESIPSTVMPVPDSQNNSVFPVEKNDGIQVSISEENPVGVAESTARKDDMQKPSDVQSNPTSEKIVDPLVGTVRSDVKPSMLAEPTTSKSVSPLSGKLPDLASPIVLHEVVDTIKVVPQEPKFVATLPTGPIAQNTGSTHIDGSLVSGETRRVSPSTDITTPVPTVDISSQRSDGVSVQTKPDPVFQSVSYPTVGAINFTFIAAPKQEVDTSAIQPEVSHPHVLAATAAEASVLTGTDEIVIPITGDTDSVQAFTVENSIGSQNNIKQNAGSTKQEELPVAPLDISSPELPGISIPDGKLSTEIPVETNSIPPLQSAIPGSKKGIVQEVGTTNNHVEAVPMQGRENIGSLTETRIDEVGIQDDKTSAPAKERSVIVPSVVHSDIPAPVVSPVMEDIKLEVFPLPVVTSDDVVDVPIVDKPTSVVPPVTGDVQSEMSFKPFVAGVDPVDVPIVQSNDIRTPVAPLFIGDGQSEAVPMSTVTNSRTSPIQVDTVEDVQSFFPYIKPDVQPQKIDDAPQPEQPKEPDIPVVPEPTQSVTTVDHEAGEISSSEKVLADLQPVSDLENSDIRPIADAFGEPSVIEGDGIQTTVSKQPANAVSQTAASYPAIASTRDPEEYSDGLLPQSEPSVFVADEDIPDSYTPVEPEGKPRMEQPIIRERLSGEEFVLPKQSGHASTYDNMPSSDVSQPLPVRLQTTGDMIGLGFLLREVQRNEATITRLSITMPQQTPDMTIHSPKANSNQTEKVEFNKLVTESVNQPFPPSDQMIADVIDTPVETLSIPNKQTPDPLPTISRVSEPIIHSESKIGTSIEELSEIGSNKSEPKELFGQQATRERAEVDSPSRMVQQPVASNTINSVSQLHTVDRQVTSDREMSAKGIEQTLPKLGERAFIQPQETGRVPELSTSSRTVEQTDPQRLSSSGNSEASASRALPAGGNISRVSDTTPVIEQSDAIGVAIPAAYNAVVRSGASVRTTAGRLSAARNAVESLRENTTRAVPVSIGKESVDGSTFEPLMRSNSEGREHSQTPFRQELQNSNVVPARDERLASPAGNDAYQKIADHEKSGSEDVHSKNPVRPESIHPGVPLPTMPKITAPVVRTYRNVPQQEIPQIVQSAVRTFPSSGGAIQMTLAPEALGEVLIAISVRDSITEVRIDTETHESRRIIEAQLPALREKLAQVGLQVEHIEVRTKPQDTVQSDASRSGRQGNQTQEEQKSRQDFVRSFRHLAGDAGREQPEAEIKRVNPYRMRGGNFERYA